MSDKIQPLEQLETELVFENPWFQLRRDAYKLPSGAVGEYHYVRTPGSVFVLPRTSRGTFLLVRQYRYLNQAVSLEFPGGGVPTGVGTEDAARAELAEEAGVIAGHLRLLGKFNPCNGLVDEICTVYLADDLSAAGEVAHDEAENIEVVEVSIRDLDAMIRNGELWDGMTLAAWSLFKVHEA